MFKNFSFTKTISFLLLALNLAMVFYYYNLKTGFHIDELFGYAHANSTKGAFLSDKIDAYFYDYKFDVRNKWIKGEVFHNYITVQDDEQFKYGHILDNIKKDVHPPLYHALLHTVCSFFVDGFSKWYGASLQIMIWVGLLFSLFKFAKLFFDDDKIVLLAVCFYAFSQVGFNTVLFIRMYALQTLFLVLLLYETLLLIRDNQVNKKRLLLIFLWTALGVLTQYSSLVFSFIITLITSFVLLYRKNIYLLSYYLLAMSAGVSVLFFVFPEAWDVLLFSQRGTELFDSIEQKKFLVRFDNFFSVSTTQLLSLNNIYFRFIFLMLFAVFLICYKEKNESKMFFWMLLFIAFICKLWLYFAMPYQHLTGTRYHMPLMPLWAVLIIYMVLEILKSVVKNKKIIYAVLSGLIVINSYYADFSNKSGFSFQNDEGTNEFLDEIKGKKVYFVSSDFWTLFEQVNWFKDVDEVYINIFPCDISLRRGIKKFNKGDFFVYINKDVVDGKPVGRNKVCNNLDENFDFIKTIIMGERYYDVYKIRKNK